MNGMKDILDDRNMRQRPYSVPDGYFDRLELRLSEIPGSASAPSGWRVKVRPALAIAASFATVLLVGGMILGRATGPKEEMSLYEQYAYADLIPHTEPFAFFESSQEVTASEDDIMDYLLENNADITEGMQQDY